MGVSVEVCQTSGCCYTISATLSRQMLHQHMPDYMQLHHYERLNVSEFCALLCDCSESWSPVTTEKEIMNIIRKATNSVLSRAELYVQK